MAPNKSAELKAFHQQWNNGAPIIDLDEKHRFTQAFAESLAASDPRWGRKARADGAGPLSKDTLGYWLGAAPFPTTPTDGQLDARDIIRSSGETAWDGEGNPAYDNILARWYPVSATPEPPDPPDPPDPGPDPAHVALEKQIKDLQRQVEQENDILTARILQLTERVDALVERVLALEHPEPREISTSRQWGHAHKVTV